jgi:hypothetical protein
MKTAIFTWLFLLPIQMFAGNYNSRFTEGGLERVTIEAEFTESEEADLMRYTKIIAESENYQALAVSLEQEVQKLKSQLAHKNNEINSQEMSQWKSQTSTLIFFVGMLIFAFLYIRNKLYPIRPELITIHNYNPEK